MRKGRLGSSASVGTSTGADGSAGAVKTMTSGTGAGVKQLSKLSRLYSVRMAGSLTPDDMVRDDLRTTQVAQAASKVKSGMRCVRCQFNSHHAAVKHILFEDSGKAFGEYNIDVIDFKCPGRMFP